MIKPKVSEWVMSVLIALLIMLGTTRNTFTLLAFGLCAVCVVLYNERSGLCILMFIVSFAFVFKINPNSTSLFTFVFLLYVLWITVQHKHFASLVGWIIIFICYLVGVQCFNDTLNVTQTIKMLANLLFWYYTVELIEPGDYDKIYPFYIGGVITAAMAKLSGLFQNFDLYIGNKESYLMRFTSLHEDPNYFAVNVLIAMCLLVVLYHKKKTSLPVFLVLSGAFVYFISLTASKSAFLMLFLPILLMLYSNAKNKRYFLQLSLLAGLLFFGLCLHLGKIEMFEKVLERFREVDDIQEMTTGRAEHWKDYLSFSFSSVGNLFFGAGLGAPLYQGTAAHNSYADCLYFMGTIGTVGIVVIVCMLLLNCNERCPGMHRNLLNLSVWMCIAMMYFFLSELNYFDMPFHIVIALMVWNEAIEPLWRKSRRGILRSLKATC